MTTIAPVQDGISQAAAMLRKWYGDAAPDMAKRWEATSCDSRWLLVAKRCEQMGQEALHDGPR